MNDQQQKYSIEHLINYVGLHAILTGEKLKTLTLTPDFYTWYVQHAQQLCEAYNFTSRFKDGKVIFNGVELIKKSKIDLV